jgi:hypothetical protein
MLSPMTDHCFLLAATAPDPAFTGNLVVVLCLVGNAVASIIALVIAARRRPPFGEEIYKEFARRQEWTESTVVLHNRIDRNKVDVEKLADQVSKGFQDVERALGRIEGSLKMIKDNDNG